MFHVLLGRFRGMVGGVLKMPLGGVRVVGRHLVVACFVMRRCLAVMPGRVFVMFRC